MFRLSRPCYDKFHRCPGWNGGGPRFAKVRRCDSGRILVDYEAVLWKWRPWQCSRCNVVVWPYMTRWLSPWQWWWAIKHWAADEVYLIRHEWRDARSSGNGSAWSMWWLVEAECTRVPAWLRLRRTYAREWWARQRNRLRARR